MKENRKRCLGALQKHVIEVIRLLDDSPYLPRYLRIYSFFISISSRPIINLLLLPSSVCGIEHAKRKYAKQKINFVIFLFKVQSNQYVRSFYKTARPSERRSLNMNGLKSLSEVSLSKPWIRKFRKLKSFAEENLTTRRL